MTSVLSGCGRIRVAQNLPLQSGHNFWHGTIRFGARHFVQAIGQVNGWVFATAATPLCKSSDLVSKLWDDLRWRLSFKPLSAVKKATLELIRFWMVLNHTPHATQFTEDLNRCGSFYAQFLGNTCEELRKSLTKASRFDSPTRMCCPGDWNHWQLIVNQHRSKLSSVGPLWHRRMTWTNDQR